MSFGENKQYYFVNRQRISNKIFLDLINKCKCQIQFKR